MEETRSTSRLGISRILLRRAWHYLKKGEGTHYIDSPDYDNVRVRTNYEWKYVGQSGQGSLRVEFRRGSETIRYVEFGCTMVGAGGPPAIYECT